MHLNECFGKESALSAVECIASGWLVKSKTIFYIPDEAYAGYTYLYNDGPDILPPQGMGLNNIARQHHQQLSSTPVAHHRRHTFVQAKEVNNLHQHQHSRHYNHLQNKSIMMNYDVGEKLPHVNNVTSTIIPPNVNFHASFTSIISQQQVTAPITVP